MYLLGYLSLMALTISTGLVVDDAIIVLENASQLDVLHYAQGQQSRTRYAGFACRPIRWQL